MELDQNTRAAIDHLCRNGTRFKQDFFSGTGAYPLKIQAIKQLRDEFRLPGGMLLGLREAKDAVEAWEAGGCLYIILSEPEAKILLRNLLLRGGQSGLTPLEVEAIRRLSE